VPTAAAELIPTPPPRGFAAGPAAPTPTLSPTQVAQQQFCEQASPGAHLPVPLEGLSVLIPQPRVPTQPLAVSGGPRQEGADPPPDVSAQHVAIVDDESGRLLYGKEPFTRVAPASITKIATTIVALEHDSDLGTVYSTTVSATALVACDGSSVMGLEPGDHVRFETLLYGMMLPSGNDADNHYSSAYDMALIGRYAMRNPTFRTIVATPRFVGDDYYMHNLNSLLGVYPGADGVKIGYTDIAGHTIVASATRDGHRVYVALMHSRDIHTESIKLFDWVWANFRWL
jgi:D-alanyl-D-alanine carboxypeptidase